jgi:hypothetical protein
LIRGILKRLNKRFHRPKRYYEIDGFVLDMGKNHLLSNYQEDSPMFSRIIPYLGELVEEIRGEHGVIVDLGANVGDTVAALIKHTNAVVLCVEPTDEYYHLLNKNVFIMDAGERIRTIQAFISNKKRNYQAIVSGGGTAVQQEASQSTIPTFSLPEVFVQCDIALDQVALIKTSTSGNDAGAVLSLEDSLYEMNPIFYIETDMSTTMDRAVLNRQLESYLQMDDYLAVHGYESCFIFDNFGNLLCTGTPETLKHIHSYMHRMATGKSNRTFYYVYVLACRKEFEARCADMLKRYVRDYAG